MQGEKTLVLCEKPDAAMRVSVALDEKENPQKKKLNGVPYFEARLDGRILLIVPTLGHLYTVAPLTRKRDVYPVFDFAWVPKHEAERKSKETKAWIEAIKRLSLEAQDFILATDYDIEGATIGYTILKYACGEKDKEAKRMKFSTLTSTELRNAYRDLIPHIEFPIVEAGVCRHFLDVLYGVNLSRAMTVAAKRVSGKYVTLSTGRVQGPTLSFLVEREKEINSFVPTPYWTLRAKIEVDGSSCEADYQQDIIETRSQAESIIDACRGKNGKIDRIEVKNSYQSPPVPFNLGTLQTEAYSLFRYTPKRTADIAERLYLDALISYPRTSSQKLPQTIDYRAILKSLSREPKYRELTSKLLNRERLIPNEGGKDDPAHPAIYPTENTPGRPLSAIERSLWDLIVKRFMAVFADPALKQSVKATVIVEDHSFYLYGRQILSEGWMSFYKPHVRVEESLLPPLKEGEEIAIQEIALEDRFTKPPPRHNPSSLLKKMEDAEIGTKATRSEIIDTLYRRKYISEERITVSDLGFDIISALARYCPEVISIDLTRDLEKKMNEIQEERERTSDALDEATSHLIPIMEELKRNEEALGRALSEAIKKARMQERIVGGCPICQTGKLTILYSKRTGKRFIGCNNYFKGACKTSFPLPQKGTVKPAHSNCRTCGWPMVQFRMIRRRPWTFCINLMCSSREGGK